MSSKKEPYQFSQIAEELIGDFRGVQFTEPRRMRKRATKDIAPLVEELLVKFQIGRDSPEHCIREKWTEIVGHANASYSHALMIDPKGRLLVNVSHAVVRNELFMHRSRILAEIKKIPGCNHVREIQFRSG